MSHARRFPDRRPPRSARYGRYTGDPTLEHLSDHFYLQPVDLERLSLLRQDHTRLGFALQLCTLRFLGTFLQDPNDADIARLSPLKFAHINVLGRYHFEMSPDVAAGDLRPLRDPDSLETLERSWIE